MIDNDFEKRIAIISDFIFQLLCLKIFGVWEYNKPVEIKRRRNIIKPVQRIMLNIIKR